VLEVVVRGLASSELDRDEDGDEKEDQEPKQLPPEWQPSMLIIGIFFVYV